MDRAKLFSTQGTPRPSHTRQLSLTDLKARRGSGRPARAGALRGRAEGGARGRLVGWQGLLIGTRLVGWGPAPPARGPVVTPPAHAPRSRRLRGRDSVLRPHGRWPATPTKVRCPPSAQDAVPARSHSHGTKTGDPEPHEGSGCGAPVLSHGPLAGRGQSKTGLPSTRSGSEGLGCHPSHPIRLLTGPRKGCAGSSVTRVARGRGGSADSSG